MIQVGTLKPFNPHKEYVIAQDNILPTYNGKNLLNVKPVTQRIDFTGGVNIDNTIVWNDDNTKVTITHTMNCIPVLFVYNENNQQVLPDVQVIDANTIEIDFKDSIEGESYYCIINYGTQYGNPTVISNTLMTLVEQATTAKNEAVYAKNIATIAKNEAVSAKEDAVDAKNETEQTVNQLKITLGACTSLGMITGDNQLSFSWIDPDNVILDSAILATWNKTVLVRKQGTSYPTSVDDGTIVATTSVELENKNYYRDHNFVDDTIQNGKTYKYKLFSQNTYLVWNNLVANEYTDGTGLNWYQIQQYVRAGRGAELFPVGTVFEVKHDEYQHQDGTGLLFRVVGHDQVQAQDETLTHTMCLEMVDCLFSASYDNYEAQYALTEDTTAKAGKSYYSLSESTYTLLVEGTDYEAGDSVPSYSWYEKNFQYRKGYGSNNAVQSNAIQWLNASEVARQWFSLKTIWDTCSETLLAKNGFCKHIDSDFLNVVKPAKLITAKCNAEGGDSITHYAKFWLLSFTQVFGESNTTITENTWLSYYQNGGDKKKTLKDSASYVIWSLRSPFISGAYQIYYVNTSGTYETAGAVTQRGFSPACIIA